jgi:DNA-directed RNA polymerase specialized sigma24 family protein
MKYSNRPFDNLRIKTRAVFVLHLAGFTNKEIANICHISLRTIIRYIQAGLKEYPDIAMM